MSLYFIEILVVLNVMVSRLRDLKSRTCDQSWFVWLSQLERQYLNITQFWSAAADMSRLREM